MAESATGASRFDTIVEALRRLGGQARPAEIAKEIRRIYPGPHPPSLLQSVRGRIQECSSDSRIWQGKRDLFYSVHGIGGGVWGLRTLDLLNPANEEGFADSVEPYIGVEGQAILRTHLRRERSKTLVRRFKESLSSFACEICGFDFGKAYGNLGQGFIEAHHIIPVAALEAGSRTKIDDLAAVCANCHRMLHRRSNCSIAELRAIIRER